MGGIYRRRILATLILIIVSLYHCASGFLNARSFLSTQPFWNRVGHFCQVLGCTLHVVLYARVLSDPDFTYSHRAAMNYIFYPISRGFETVASIIDWKMGGERGQPRGGSTGAHPGPRVSFNVYHNGRISLEPSTVNIAWLVVVVLVITGWIYYVLATANRFKGGRASQRGCLRKVTEFFYVPWVCQYDESEGRKDLADYYVAVQQQQQQQGAYSNRSYGGPTAI